MLDDTHDRGRQSWVASANGHAEFPLQNLPFGVFSPPGSTVPDARPRGGVAIGDMILDLRAAHDAGLFTGAATMAAAAASGPTLNPLMALGAEPRRALRRQVFTRLATGGAAEPLKDKLLHNAANCWLHVPATIGNFTDFFAGIHHATNGGRRRDPNNPLNPNYKYIPVAYHSRASSVRESNVSVRRPNGQRKSPNEEVPSYGPCRNLDYELELAVWIGPGNRQGEPIPIERAGEHVFGLGLVNDWSARDIQYWEMPPLGPFLGKNFASTVSPWIVTAEALEPFRVAQPPRPAGDPQPLPYLWDDKDQQSGAFDIRLEALLLTPQMREKGLAAHRMSRSNTTDLYWTVAQLVAHHACGGCNLLPGDLFGSGTISGPSEEGYGSLSELSQAGTKTITLHTGETRSYLDDGDEVIFRAYCEREGYAPIGFGECRARVVA
jgi:fumarylacetoacetase